VKWYKVTQKEINHLFQQGYQFSPEDIKELRADMRVGVQNFIRRWDTLQKERERVSRLYHYERELYKKGLSLIAGVDEAGRGPLAGPVVAGAVILPCECFIPGLNDSKKIGESKRYHLAAEIKKKAVAWAVGAVGAHDIDKLNILEATRLAMIRAVKNLTVWPEYLLTDAVFLREISLSQTVIIKGDAKCASIAAASILAKCHRDNLMKIYDQRFPGYGFARHKGYPTPEHFTYLMHHGETIIHRKTFKGVVQGDAKDHG
jgi:ribonuclease HII